MVEQEYDVLKEEFQYGGHLKDNKQFKCLVIMPIGKNGTAEYKNNILVFDRIIKPCADLPPKKCPL